MNFTTNKKPKKPKIELFQKCKNLGFFGPIFQRWLQKPIIKKVCNMISKFRRLYGTDYYHGDGRFMYA